MGGWVGFVECKILYRVKDSIACVKGRWVGEGWARVDGWARGGSPPSIIYFPCKKNIKNSKSLKKGKPS
jgi:hypothetical protein